MESSSIKNADTVASYFRYWGKVRKEDEEGAPYHLLPHHCLGVVADRLTVGRA